MWRCSPDVCSIDDLLPALIENLVGALPRLPAQKKPRTDGIRKPATIEVCTRSDQGKARNSRRWRLRLEEQRSSLTGALDRAGSSLLRFSVDSTRE
jgi:hypothetical protein